MSNDIEAFERHRLAGLTAAEAVDGFARAARMGFSIADARWVGGGPPGLVEQIRARFGLD